jgi:hypothetical protein
LRTQREGILRPKVDCYGYATVDLRRGGTRRTVSVHHVVAEAFHGARFFDGAAVNHIDPVKRLYPLDTRVNMLYDKNVFRKRLTELIAGTQC